MTRRNKIPTALTIAGSDSGGGAGIQADLNTFAALGVHGTCAVTCVTAQNPGGVRSVEGCHPKMVRQQIEAVFEEFSPAAIKTGLLFSSRIVRAVVHSLERDPCPKIIVDPVRVATSGARLLAPAALNTVKSRLLPLADLVTPNLDEAAALVGRSVGTIDEMRSVAREIKSRFGCAALIKGGHLRGGRDAVDVFFDGTTELLLSAPFVRGVRTHGTGCTYASAIAGYLALGRELPRAVELAKRYVTGAIACHFIVNGHTILNHFWERKK